MGKQYDFETRDRAEDLYICQGLTLEQVAASTGVSLSQVKEWSTTGGWRERREEYRQALREIKMDTVRLRQKLIKKALDTLNPQYAYAAANVERMAHQVGPKPTQTTGEIPEAPELREMPESPGELRTPEQAVAALQEAAEAKLVIMLSRPGELDRKALKDYQDMLALIDELKNKYAPQEAGKKTDLDDETKQRIRDIYGL